MKEFVYSYTTKVYFGEKSAASFAVLDPAYTSFVPPM